MGTSSMLTANINDLEFMAMAMENRQFSPDPSTKVGSVIVCRQGIAASMSANKFPSGVIETPKRWNDRAQKYPRVVHAELGAILNAGALGVDIRGGTLYTTEYPCCTCCGAIITAGISRVVTLDLQSDYAERWTDQIAISVLMFQEAGVELTMLPR